MSFARPYHYLQTPRLPGEDESLVIVNRRHRNIPTCDPLCRPLRRLGEPIRLEDLTKPYLRGSGSLLYM